MFATLEPLRDLLLTDKKVMDRTGFMALYGKSDPSPLPIHLECPMTAARSFPFYDFQLLLFPFAILSNVLIVSAPRTKRA